MRYSTECCGFIHICPFFRNVAYLCGSNVAQAGRKGAIQSKRMEERKASAFLKHRSMPTSHGSHVDKPRAASFDLCFSVIRHHVTHHACGLRPDPRPSPPYTPINTPAPLVKNGLPEKPKHFSDVALCARDARPLSPRPGPCPCACRCAHPQTRQANSDATETMCPLKFQY